MPPLMTLPQKRADRLRMIELAIQEQASRLYRELKRSGTLRQVVEGYEQEMMAAYEAQEEELMFQAARKGDPDTLRRLQDYETRTRELWEQTLATFLDFRDPEPRST